MSSRSRFLPFDLFEPILCRAEPLLIAQTATQIQQIARVNAGPLWRWLLAAALVLTVAANLRDSDKVNDGEPDSCHLPPWVQIYGTAEVETDKLAFQKWERGSPALLPGCLILNHRLLWLVLSRWRPKRQMTWSSSRLLSRFKAKWKYSRN